MSELTRNFSFSEFAVSKDFPNLAKQIQFSKQDKQKIFYLTKVFLQPFRDYLNAPVIISSGKRSVELNKAVKGTLNSDHLFQEFSIAVDFSTERLNASWEYLYNFCETRKFLVKQLIYYLDGNFIHLSLVDGSRKCFQVLYCVSREQRLYVTSFYEAVNYMQTR